MQNTTELSEAKRILFAKYLRGNPPQKTSEATIPRRTQGNAIPLSFGQQQMWLLSQLIPDTPVYNECVTLHLPGPLDVAALEQSFGEIIRRHEAWRTSFPVVDGQPVQIIHPSSPFALPFVDLRHLPKVEREAEALRLATEDGRKSFDLAHGPLLRALLIQLEDMEHRLYLTLHHIIFDGVSVYQVFLSELRTLYEAFSARRPSPLLELSIQYADFAIWQREQLQADMLDTQLGYWKRQLEDAPAVLELPTDQPRPLTATYRGSTSPICLSKRLTDSLREVSRQQGCSLYMTLLAAFKTLLYRYTGQHDILVGTATAGRKHPQLHNLLGVFINMLVMRTRFTGDLSFKDLLERVREETLEAYAHQDVPFEYLVKELQPQRAVGQNPFFQVLFMLEPPVSVLPSGWTLTHMNVKTDTSKFDLSLILEDRPEGLVGFFEYSTDLFETTTIERMVGHLQVLLEGIIHDPAQSLAELPLLTEAERHQLLVEPKHITTDSVQGKGLHQLFEAQVQRTPEAVAVSYEQEQLTYHDLNMKANQLAHSLRRLGVGPETLVGVCVERSIELIVSLVAILKAGGAYVPLDPTWPTERLAFVLADTQTPLVLTQDRLVSSLPDYQGHVLCLDGDWQAIAQESMDNPFGQVTEEQLAYVIYTSGSTGKPKGVLVSHANVVRLFAATESRFHFDAQDVWTLFHSYAFDFSVWELWGALLYGGRLVVVPYWVCRSLQAFLELLCKEQVTILNQTPSAFYQLMQAEQSSRSEHKLSLRFIIFGGEALEFQRLKAWFERHEEQSPQLVNMYGITETTVHVTYYPVRAEDTRGPCGSLIGRPIPDLAVYLLDQHKQLVPIGVAGEIYVGGAGVARGYLHRPELTRERFVPNPFSQQPGARLYRSGDLARYRPDGTLEFLGRIDQQVKVRGFRIELGEIEHILRQHPEVRETVVMAREDAQDDKRLVAYIVNNQGKSISTNMLHSYLKGKLPHYMMPSAFVMLRSLPLTSNGKIDRRALPPPNRIQHAKEETFVAPLMTVHHQLIQIWEELLGVHPIGLKDNFFSLGGHSLLAARLVDGIEQVCGKKIPLATLFAGATVEHLANVIMGEEETRPRAPVVAVQARGTKRPFFFLHGDWFGGGFYCLNLARGLDPDQPFYVLEPYNFEGLPIPPTFEAMAAAHIQSLRTIQPEGPYLVGGFCNGGLMAYEMARQLHAEGQVVDLLVTIDLAKPTPHKVVRRALNRIGGILRIGQDKQVNWFLWYIYARIPSYRTKVKDSIAARNTQSERGQKRGKVSLMLSKLKALFPPVEALRHQWSGIYRWVAAGYVPGSYPGKLTLFWSNEAFTHQVDWRQISQAQEIEDIVFPGTHMSCQNENLHILAERLSTCLNEAQATEASE